jgi:cell division protein ZapA
MAQVTIQVNGRPYRVGCEDGQEDHLAELARQFDRQVRTVGQEVGQLGETRLFLMGALLLADELTDTQARLAQLQTELARVQSEYAHIEAAAVAALDTAATRIESLAARAAG